MYYFGQHKPTTQYLGYECNVLDMPHYKFVGGDIESYKEYLKKSWGLKEFESKHQNKINEFKNLIKNIEKNGIITKTKITKSVDNRNIIIDGNHRTSIGTYYGLDIPTTEIDNISYIKKLVNDTSNHRFGSKEGLPYQSIYFNKKEVVKGIREDVIERQEKIGDLTDKTIIDFGCNFGSSSILSTEYGARKVIGLEYAPSIVQAACRINSILNKPVEFHCVNLSNTIVNFPKSDIGYVFSLDLHVNNEFLIKNIKRNVSDIIFFECNTGKTIPLEIKKLFVDIEYLGENFGGRKFYKCYLKQ